MIEPDEPASRVDVSLVVVTHNSSDVVGQCLTALAGGVLNYASELYVVDNASLDGTVERVRQCAPAAHIIELDRNVGFARANNVAISRAAGRYIALVNSDAFVDPGAIDCLIRLAESEDRIGIVGGRLRYPSGRPQPSAGRFPSLLGNLGVALFLHRLPPTSWLPLSLYAGSRQYAKPRRVDWVSAAFCLARREIGPIPADGFMYGEDVEWALSARIRGLETWIEPAATACHLVGGGANSVSAARLRQVRRAQFDLRWFAPRGQGALTASRIVMAIHAALRIAVYAAVIPVRRAEATAKIREYGALLRAAFGSNAQALEERG